MIILNYSNIISKFQINVLIHIVMIFFIFNSCLFIIFYPNSMLTPVDFFFLNFLRYRIGYSHHLGRVMKHKMQKTLSDV